MKEYKVSGLSCPNCTLELEAEIKRLKHAQDAKLSYTRGKLKISPDVDLKKVKSILSTENATLIAEHDHHSHGDMSKEKWLLIVAAVLYLLAIVVDYVNGTAWIAIPIYLVAMVLSGHKTFLKGLRNLIGLRFTIDTLMTVALIGAVAIGEWKEGTLVAILFGLNELLEGLGMEKARNSVEKLLDLAPKSATLLSKEGEAVVPVETLKEGDVVLIKAGETIPSDGIVIEGSSSVNESAITGESLPVEKTIGEQLFGGSINNEGNLKIKITKTFEDSSLAKILHLVEEAQETKTPTELFINRFAKYYTPFIMLFAMFVILLPPLFFQGEWSQSLYQGLAVLIVGCPCALILSSPIANISGITRNARNGILIKGSVFLELLGKLDTFIFDKTGTLTKGRPYIEKEIVYDANLFYPIVYAVEKTSTHPLAKAIMEKVTPKVPEIVEATDVTAVVGKGIKATIKGETYWVGNEKNLAHLQVPENILADIQAMKDDGLTLVLVASDQHVLGLFGIADEVRKESGPLMKALKEIGVRRRIMLTGDHKKTATNVAQQLDLTDVYSDLLPAEKAEKVKELMQEGHVVGMVGDGINDAPALATAHVGIAMGKGTDSAIETADVVLMQDHLGKLPEAVQVAKRVNRLIRINITIALSLKAIALLLTVPGLLTLWIAILSDMGATVLVTILSLTIMIQRKQK